MKGRDGVEQLEFAFVVNNTTVGMLQVVMSLFTCNGNSERRHTCLKRSVYLTSTTQIAHKSSHSSQSSSHFKLCS